MNYVLLNNPDILVTKASAATENLESTGGKGTQAENVRDNNAETRSKSSAVLTLNTKEGYAKELIEEMVQEKMKDDGQLEKIRKKKRSEEELADSSPIGELT